MVGLVRGSPEKDSVTRTVVETSPDLKKKAAPVFNFDEAWVWEHLGTTGSGSHKPIWPARYYRGLSTESSTAAAMAIVAGLSYGLI